MLGQHKTVTSDHFEHLRIICNGAGPVKEADAEKVLARSKNKSLRFCQGKIYFYFFQSKLVIAYYVLH